MSPSLTRRGFRFYSPEIKSGNGLDESQFTRTNELAVFSNPIVVSGPCPGNTMV